ncbi:MAG: HAD-IIIA family hydrolase [Chloroflexota bacterium]
MSAQKLIVGHLTDFHARQAIHGSAAVLARRSRDIFDLLPEAIDILKTQGVNFLAITGDLVDVPTFILSPDDYYQTPLDDWLPSVRADYEQLKEILDSSGLPYMVLPGNHDYEPIFWQVFEKVPLYYDIEQGYRLVRFCDREWAGHIPRRFDRERKLWEKMLADEKSPPQIHLQHYVIKPELNEGYPHTYFEGESLKAQNTASGRVILSLSGHYHRGTDLISQDGCHFAVGPAFCEFPHPFRIYEIEDRQVNMHTLTLLKRPHQAGRKVVFLDRDGVINDAPSYNTGPEALALIPGAGEAILKLRQAGYAVVVNTSQSCVGLGYVSRETINTVHERMCQLLVGETGNHMAQPDAIFFSTEAGKKAVHPTLVDHALAKPSPALLQQAETLLALNPQNAWMVGDRLSDLQAGLAYGATPILVRTGAGRQTENALKQKDIAGLVICDNLVNAVNHILSRIE